LVTYGDMPLLQGETLQALVRLFEGASRERQAAVAMLTITRDDPQGFGRIIRDASGEVVAIVEEADCTPEQRRITELNPGVYCFDADWLWQTLPQIPMSPKGEYYLTDMVGLAVQQGRAVVTTQAPLDDVYGINTRVHLAEATATMRQRILHKHMLAGVTIVDPPSTWIDATVEIGADTTIWPGTILQGNCTIGAFAGIGPNTHIVASHVGDGTVIKQSVIEFAHVEEHCEIGPFCHLRKGAHLATGVHMGNFGEVKNSYLGPGAKMGHFSYLGDAQVGADVNIGAGTITCNYDGQAKHKTVIGDGAFIGSDTLLVAPVEIGPGAKTGAGSVVTRDVDAGELAYGVPARSQKQHK
jgi:bifunctional UDP-N-acetylglucosamine pyrophosphorylase/glucosamine-1-phosphate N-acetyltransferase